MHKIYTDAEHFPQSHEIIISQVNNEEPGDTPVCLGPMLSVPTERAGSTNTPELLYAVAKATKKKAEDDKNCRQNSNPL